MEAIQSEVLTDESWLTSRRFFRTHSSHLYPRPRLSTPTSPPSTAHWCAWLIRAGARQRKPGVGRQHLLQQGLSVRGREGGSLECALSAYAEIVRPGTVASARVCRPPLAPLPPYTHARARARTISPRVCVSELAGLASRQCAS